MAVAGFWRQQPCLEGKTPCEKTPAGNIPTQDALYLDQLHMTKDDLKILLSVDTHAWAEELQDIDKFFQKFGDKLPERMQKQFAQQRERLEKS